MTLHLQPTFEDHRIAILTAFAITIHLFESLLPPILPGIKPGLANIISLISLILFGWRVMLQVTLLRIFVSSLLLGTFLSPTFLLSLSGALCSSLLLILLFPLLSIINLSVISLSLLSAMAHILGQFYCAYLLFIPHSAIFHLLPILVTIAVILGLTNGIISKLLLQRMQS